MFELFHTFKGTIINLYIVTPSCIRISRHDHVLSFSACTARPISLLATTKASVFFSVVCRLSTKLTNIYAGNFIIETRLLIDAVF
jgi:hypothetical protein